MISDLLGLRQQHPVPKTYQLLGTAESSLFSAVEVAPYGPYVFSGLLIG